MTYPSTGSPLHVSCPRCEDTYTMCPDCLTLFHRTWPKAREVQLATGLRSKYQRGAFGPYPYIFMGVEHAPE